MRDGVESLVDADAGSMRANTYGGGQRFSGAFYFGKILPRCNAGQLLAEKEKAKGGRPLKNSDRVGPSLHAGNGIKRRESRSSPRPSNSPTVDDRPLGTRGARSITARDW